MSSSNPFHELPTELVRVIFELSAQLDRSTALSLVCTSRTVRGWIEPVLYSSVPLLTRKRFKAFCGMTGSKGIRAPETLSLVKALHLPLDDFKYETQALLSRCPNVTHLAINAKQFCIPDQCFNPIPTFPTRLVLFGAIPDGCDFKIFRNVTHLSIFSVPVLVHLEASVFPVLTHFMSIYCLDNTPISIFTRAIHKTIRQREGYTPLKLMVINVCAAPARPDYDHSLELWKHEEELLQDNVLLRPSERLTLSEWEREARGDGTDDRWTDAEAEFERRKSHFTQLSYLAHRLMDEDRLLVYSPTPLPTPDNDEMDVDPSHDLGLDTFKPPSLPIGSLSEPPSLAALAVNFPHLPSPRELDRHASEGSVNRPLKGSLPNLKRG